MKFILKVLPPKKWRFPVLLITGIFIGLFFFLFYVSKAYSSLSDNPETCVNCHIMSPQYATWNHSSHRRYTSCNDCHVPHNNVFNKYFFKAKDGMRHASMFALRMEPQVVVIQRCCSIRSWFPQLRIRRYMLPTGFAGNVTAKFRMAV
jgi:cytochrome c nitrite reductase small subunit